MTATLIFILFLLLVIIALIFALMHKMGEPDIPKSLRQDQFSHLEFDDE